MFQRSNLLAWPRASWKQRLLAAVFAAIFVSDLIQQWPHRHDGLALARWIAWSLIGIGLWFGVLALLVVILGRLPKTYALVFDRPRRLKMTLSEIHDDIARQEQAVRDRTRPL